jgi:hypothetical protein
MKKVILGSLFAVALVLGVAAPAFAHDCVNLSKNTASPTVVIGAGGTACADQPTSAKQGIVQRINNFGFDQDGNPNFQFHGPTGLDTNCDGVADFVSYSPGQGTGGVVPGAENGKGVNASANCKGLTNYETAVADGCLPG